MLLHNARKNQRFLLKSTKVIIAKHSAISLFWDLYSKVTPFYDRHTCIQNWIISHRKILLFFSIISLPMCVWIFISISWWHYLHFLLDFDRSESFENPVLQQHYMNLEALALDLMEPEKAEDLTGKNNLV